jgi:hypothetical protein
MEELLAMKEPQVKRMSGEVEGFTTVRGGFRKPFRD